MIGDGNDQNYSVTFRRDSLAVVGGLLTIEAKGRFTTFWGLDGSFDVTTDTLGTNGDTIQTKRILIDQDPSNSLFADSLKRDRIRALAWKEAAGFIPYPPHQHGYYQWNHYWPDTKTPCENGVSTATGIMQIMRKWWHAYFAAIPRIPADTGYVRATWDSLAWNWQALIRNGKFIHDVYLPNRFMSTQKLFPDSCPFADCDTFPSKKNKEDLKAYGYYTNETMMAQILSDADWKTKIGTTPPPTKEAEYVQDIRKYTYRKPWR